MTDREFLLAELRSSLEGARDRVNLYASPPCYRYRIGDSEKPPPYTEDDLVSEEIPDEERLRLLALAEKNVKARARELEYAEAHEDIQDLLDLIDALHARGLLRPQISV